MHLQLQEMRRARDARVVVADALLATGLQRILFEIEGGICDLSQIIFDDALVLRSWRDKVGFEDRAIGIETIAVIKDAARRLGAGVSHGGPRLGGQKRPRRWLVGGDQAQSLATGIGDLERADED